MGSYRLLGPVWNKPTVTWFWAGGQDGFAGEVREAFASWDSVIGLDFAEVGSASAADITLRWQYIDGAYSVLGKANYSFTTGANSSFIDAEILFDSFEPWVWSNSRSTFVTPGGSSFYELALHEIGHVIGLDHVDDASTIMYPVSTGPAQDLTPGDILGAQAMYGPETAPVPPMSVSQPAAKPVLVGTGGNDTLNSDAANAQFDTAAGQVVRLYQVALGRVPDKTGHADWTQQVMDGVPLASIASNLMNSNEYHARYGAVANDTFVTLLYRSALGRDPEESGLAAWITRLNQGWSREDVVIGFSESTEFKAKSGPVSLGFSLAGLQTEWTEPVVRLYQSALDRLPEVSGLQHWTHALAKGLGFGEVVSSFLNSTEFSQVYGRLDNTQFVTQLYDNVMDRAPDPAGLSGWVGALQSGSLSRQDVLWGFSESEEFRTKTAPVIDAWMRSLGIDDRLDGRAGDDILLGGLFADEFRFSRSEGGRDAVVGFELWDTIVLHGFGFSNSASAASAFVQEGADAVLFHANGEIRLIDTQASSLTADEFVLT